MLAFAVLLYITVFIMSLNIILFEPEIPQNTGNIMRLCANAGFILHLIKPLGFVLSDKYLKRSGMDYIRDVDYRVYDTFSDCVDKNGFIKSRIFLLSTKSNTKYSNVEFAKNDVFVFGPESRGLPQDLLDKFPLQQKLIIPMKKDSRSLNLANSVSIVAFEAWRQLDFSSCHD